jgi:hypothetical protein
MASVIAQKKEKTVGGQEKFCRPCSGKCSLDTVHLNNLFICCLSFCKNILKFSHGLFLPESSVSSVW